MRRSRQTAVLAFAAAAFAAVLMLSGCSTLSAGKKYTLAKVDREMKLIEPRRVIYQEGQPDGLDKPLTTFGIKLNSGYLRYLESVGRPEVAIFAQVRLVSGESNEEDMIWQKVYLNSEDRKRDRDMVMNKDSFFPWDDIILMPPIVYDGQDILVSIRILELDQEDNARWSTIVNSAATAAVEFRPEYAVGFSAFQTALTFLIKNNPDDIEFQYDFVISSGDGANPAKYNPSAYFAPRVERPRRGNPRGKGLAPAKEQEIPYDAFLIPRQATYAVIKSEHRDRWNLPSNWLDLAQEGTRFAVAKTLKIATLDILNWPLGIRKAGGDHTDLKSPQADIYQRLFGCPLAVEGVACREPAFDASSPQRELVALRPAHGGFGSRLWQFHMAGSNLQISKGRRTPKSEGGGETMLFKDQGYLVFTVYPSDNGVDVGELREAYANNKMELELAKRTTQLSPVEFQEQLTSVTQCFVALGRYSRAKRDYKRALKSASQPADKKSAEEAFMKKVEELKKLLPQNLGTSLEAGATHFIQEQPGHASVFLLGDCAFLPKDSPTSLQAPAVHRNIKEIKAYCRKKGKTEYTEGSVAPGDTKHPLGENYSIATFALDKDLAIDGAAKEQTYELLVADKSNPERQRRFEVKWPKPTAASQPAAARGTSAAE